MSLIPTISNASVTKLAIIVHGGAGNINKSRYGSKISGVQQAVRIGYKVLQTSNDPVEAVEAAIKNMELDEAFNAGYGSMLTNKGEVEMDAIIIRGSDLKAGAVGAIRHVQHPISVSRAVMEQTQHVLLVGEGAEEFAKEKGFPIVDSEKLVSPRAREVLDMVLKNKVAATTEVAHSGEGSGGTVGAVAINSLGQIAAGTSTGGIAAKLTGRVGDTPIIGGGTFADDTVCGVSATGLGEAIMRTCVCSSIADHLRQGKTPKEACDSALGYMSSRIPEGDGGAILITNSGEIGYSFNSRIMSWAYIQENDEMLHYGIEKDEHLTTTLE